MAADKSNKEQAREKYANEYYENYLSMADAEIGKYGVLTEDQYNNLIEKYKVENIGEERMEILENYLKQFVATDEEKKELDSIKTKTALQNLNSTVDVNNVIDPQYANAKSFGSFVGSGIGKKQDTYINQIIMGAKENVFNDGDIIDANYGMGKDLYMFYGGKFYKVSEGSATVTNDNISDFFAKKGKLLPR